MMAAATINWSLVAEATNIEAYRRAGLSAKQAELLHNAELAKLQAAAAPVVKIASSADAVKVLRPHWLGLEVEQFGVLYLNRSNRVQSFEVISTGGICGTIVDERIIFRHGILKLTSGIILCHNHPSGNLQPSDADMMLTKRLKEGGKLLNITVLDHLIITADGYYSFADEGII